MTWSMTGQMYEICNCNFLCPCWFDLTAEPDQGHCKTALVLDIQSGNSDSVDLSGQKAVVGLSFPHTLAEGNATVRLYVDSSATSEQQDALEAIISGQRGGLWENLGPLVSTLLPTQKADINIQINGTPSISVEGIGQFTTNPLMADNGQPAQITGAQAMVAFQCEEGQPSRPANAEWNDTDIGSWEPRSGMILPFNWQA